MSSTLLIPPSIIGAAQVLTGDCPYCHTAKGYVADCFYVDSFTPDIYQQLTERGWSRSGSLIYRPNNKTSCCRQFPMRVHAPSFTPSKAQRRILRRFERTQIEPDNSADDSDEKQEASHMREPFSSNTGITIEWARPVNSKEHALLFEQYQLRIHQEVKDRADEQQFNSFLVRTPQMIYDNKEAETWQLGFYFQEYYLTSLDRDAPLSERTLIGFSALDVLPHALISSYFVWSPELPKLSLGVVSAVKELEYVQSRHRQDPLFQWYYIGMFVPSNKKMEYKLSYGPAQLYCSTNKRWVSMDERVLNALDHGCRTLDVAFDTNCQSNVDRQATSELSEAKSDSVPATTGFEAIDDLIVYDARRPLICTFKTYRYGCTGAIVDTFANDLRRIVSYIGRDIAVQCLHALQSPT